MGYNVLFFPWRDWNAMKVDGFRTREANILLSMINNPNIEKIICVNRAQIPKYIQLLLALKNGEGFSKKNKDINSDNHVHFDQEKLMYKRLFSQLKLINEKLVVLDINYHIPNPRGNILERINSVQDILEKEIQVALKTLGFENYITWCFDLTRIEIARRFKKDVMIFDAIDNLLEHDQKKNDFTYLSEMYRLAKENSNVIFTVSRDLKESIFSNHHNTFYIPNAINLKSYKQKDLSRPEDLPMGKPIVGYVGLMQERIDTNILEESIVQNSDVNFVFIGPVLSKSHFKNIQKYENVFFLGSKHHSMIPSYLKYFDVCIIPHKVNKFTKSMNPLKLYEYLASGKEIITTSVPPSDEYQHVVHICDGEKEFSQQIMMCIKTPFNRFEEEDILNAIQSEDWSERLKDMLTFIEKELKS
ncbi:glycosyltransferase [Neobacillus sp. SuZ13]|uniref:glycosyltransferase n=1 Tax=Neobacillus sp. SuZ13 TaxID=3047875 RepID=UPI0024BFF92F|nr:glycosyltransferase [Neobacillus sp. SuZ13]WHY66797.1 glycosyltransferase [Neobacillus sp. SuZ13]